MCDLVIDGDTASALLFVEELSAKGQDLGRLVVDLLEHLRHLLLVQHMTEVPDSLPVTDETRERLREQANQLPAPAVLRLIDLLRVAVDDMRQGGDPRLPLELALVKVTRPAADLSRESLSFRLERLEGGHVSSARVESHAPPSEGLAPQSDGREADSRSEPGSVAVPATAASEAAPAPTVELEQLQEAWRRTILPAVEERSIPIGKTLSEAHPFGLVDDTLTLVFPRSAAFHLSLAEDPKNAALLRDALYAVTGRKLAVAFALGDEDRAKSSADEEPASEEDVLELMKSTFDARELET
jgi:DNA polymerase III gamma/tau subunit